MEDERVKRIKFLIDEYKDRLRTIAILLQPVELEEKKEIRLKMKQGDYRTFLCELQSLLNKE